MKFKLTLFIAIAIAQLCLVSAQAREWERYQGVYNKDHLSVWPGGSSSEEIKCFLSVMRTENEFMFKVNFQDKSLQYLDTYTFVVKRNNILNSKKNFPDAPVNFSQRDYTGIAEKTNIKDSFISLTLVQVKSGSKDPSNFKISNVSMGLPDSSSNDYSKHVTCHIHGPTYSMK